MATFTGGVSDQSTSLDWSFTTAKRQTKSSRSPRQTTVREKSVEFLISVGLSALQDYANNLPKQTLTRAHTRSIILATL